MEIQEEVASLFQDISLLLQEQVKSLVHQHGIPFSYSMVIRYIVLDPGVTVSEIARGLGHSKGHISVLLEKMLKENLIYKETDPEDQRILRIYPTDRALSIRDSFVSIYRNMLVKVLSPIDESSLFKMCQTLKTVRNGLQEPHLSEEMHKGFNLMIQEKLGTEPFYQTECERSEEDGTDDETGKRS